jgi:hypothetical protein
VRDTEICLTASFLRFKKAKLRLIPFVKRRIREVELGEELPDQSILKE